MDENLYTFENWLAGKICPQPSLIKKDNLNNNHTFQWSNFPDGELDKIREKQKEIFYQKVHLFCEPKIKLFEKTYYSSAERERFVVNEISKLKEILFELIPGKNEYTNAEKSDLLYNTNDLREMRRYIQSIYFHSEPQDFSFIHSPNCNFQDDQYIDPKIVAEGLYIIFQYITNKTNDKQEAINDAIFDVQFGHSLCKKLVERLVLEKTKLADYGFIYHKLIEKKIIKPGTLTHQGFKEYINKTFPIKIGAFRQLPKRNNKRKEQVFDSILKEFQSLV